MKKVMKTLGYWRLASLNYFMFILTTLPIYTTNFFLPNYIIGSNVGAIAANLNNFQCSDDSDDGNAPKSGTH